MGSKAPWCVLPGPGLWLRLVTGGFRTPEAAGGEVMGGGWETPSMAPGGLCAPREQGGGCWGITEGSWGDFFHPRLSPSSLPSSPLFIPSAPPASIKAEQPCQVLTWENRHHDREHGVKPGYLDPTPVLIPVLHCQVLHGHHEHMPSGVILQGDCPPMPRPRGPWSEQGRSTKTSCCPCTSTYWHPPSLAHTRRVPPRSPPGSRSPPRGPAEPSILQGQRPCQPLGKHKPMHKPPASPQPFAHPPATQTASCCPQKTSPIAGVELQPRGPAPRRAARSCAGVGIGDALGSRWGEAVRGQGPRREGGHGGNCLVSLCLPVKPQCLETHFCFCQRALPRRAAPPARGRAIPPQALPGSGLKERKECQISPLLCSPLGRFTSALPQSQHTHTHTHTPDAAAHPKAFGFLLKPSLPQAQGIKPTLPAHPLLSWHGGVTGFAGSLQPPTGCF